MRYMIKTSLMSLWRNKFTTCIHMLCLTLGILIAAIFICQANGAIDSYRKNNEYINLDKFIIMQPSYNAYKNERIQLDDIDKVLGDLDFIEDIFVLNRLPEKILRVKDNYISGVGVFTVPEAFSGTFHNGYLLQGHWIKKNTDCVIGKKVAEKYNLKIGNRLEIDINSYVVSGIINVPKYDDSILVNEKSIVDLEIFDCTYFVKMKTDTIENLNSLYRYMLKNYADYKVKDSNEIFNEEKERLYSGWGPSIFIAIIALIYGLLNIKNIQSFYIEQTKKSIAIMMAYGANYTQVLVQKVVQNCVLAVLASILVSIIVHLLQFTQLNMVFSLKVDINAYLILLVLVQLISLVFSYFMYSKLLNKEVTEVLREKE